MCEEDEVLTSTLNNKLSSWYFLNNFCVDIILFQEKIYPYSQRKLVRYSGGMVVRVQRSRKFIATGGLDS